MYPTVTELEFDTIPTFPWAHNTPQSPKEENLSELLLHCLYSWLMAQPQQLKTHNRMGFMKIASDSKNVS